jgi:hypothetical protein
MRETRRTLAIRDQTYQVGEPSGSSFDLKIERKLETMIPRIERQHSTESYEISGASESASVQG